MNTYKMQHYIFWSTGRLYAHRYTPG